MALPDGLYDLLLTEGLARSLAAHDPISADVLALKGGAAEFLAEVITRQLGAMHLVSIMYAGMRAMDPDMETGIDLKAEYDAAVAMRRK